VQANPALPEGWIMLAAASSALGEIDEAQRAVGRCAAQWPEIRLGNVRPIYIWNCLPEEHRQRLLNVLKKAGYPE
jgi:hypothetical protein